MLACGGRRSRAARGVQLAIFAFVRKSRVRGLVGRARACDDSDPSFSHRNGGSGCLESLQSAAREAWLRHASVGGFATYGRAEGRSEEKCHNERPRNRGAPRSVVVQDCMLHNANCGAGPESGWPRAQPYGGCAARPAPAAPLFRPRDAPPPVRVRTRGAPHNAPHAQHRSRAPGPPPRTSSCCARSRATARASGPSSRRTCRAARASSAGSGGTTS